MISCSSDDKPRTLTIDMTGCAGLDDASSYRMVIHDPNFIYFADTVYWKDSKKFTYEFEDKSRDFLAFIKVDKVDDEKNSEREIFRSIVAIDANTLTAGPDFLGRVHLSGSTSNELITDFRISREQERHEALTEEMKAHPDDMYGSYLYSCYCMSEMARYIESINLYDNSSSAAVKASSLLIEAKDPDNFMTSHSVAGPFLNLFILGDGISEEALADFASYI